jgi:hypothetical protein
VATTTPKTFTTRARVSPAVVAEIIDAYHGSLRDSDTSPSLADTQYWTGAANAYEHVLELLHPEQTVATTTAA